MVNRLTSGIQGPVAGGPDRANIGSAGLPQFRSKTIQAGLSTQIVIMAQGDDGAFYTVGAVQNLAVSETRGLAQIQEVGTDGLIQVVPNTATTYSVTVQRLIFDYQRLPASLQRGFRHISAQRMPFDIEIRDYNPYKEVGDVTGQRDMSAPSVTTVIANCWFATYGYTYNQNDFQIIENATLQCETIFDRPGGGSIATGGDDTIERSANDTATNSVMSEASSLPFTNASGQRLP